jgi:hypothetical protein
LTPAAAADSSPSIKIVGLVVLNQVAKSLRQSFSGGNLGTAFRNGLDPLLLCWFTLFGRFGGSEGNQPQAG